MKKSNDKNISEVQKWFLRSVSFEDKPYTIDLEQARTVVDDSENLIVTARAGSGKTRTIVAKIIYLVARCGIRPDDIMAFVFNANAAQEINTRLGKMRVDGEEILKDAKIANTFHAFSRKVVYDWCGGKEKCKEILAEKKDNLLNLIMRQLVLEEEWRDVIKRFLLNGDDSEAMSSLWEDSNYLETELERLAKEVSQFVNRAQQQYLGSGTSLNESARKYLGTHNVEEREELFIKIGTECYDRYHRYLLDSGGLRDFSEYGTDFNLIVSWAAKLIQERRGLTVVKLQQKKYLLIDEYQDFSQLFLYEVFAIRSVAVEAKLFVVGDDLQAINRFAGSEVGFFKNFEKVFGDDSKRLVLSTNYRCGYEIVSVARCFMKKAMREKGSFRAFSHQAGEVVLVDLNMIEMKLAMTDYDYRVSEEDKRYLEICKKMLGHTPKITTMRYLKVLVEIIKKNCLVNDIMILDRNNEMSVERISLERLRDGLRECLDVFGVMDGAEYDQKIKTMTMHRSKGLEADVVIMLEADEGVIPNFHPDMKLFSIFGENDEVALEDQKRLFYVAITRAKKKLYIIYSGKTRGGFVKYLGRGVEKW